AAIAMRHAPGHVTTLSGHSHLKSVYGQARLHSGPDRVADDPGGVDVLDRAHVQLALIGPVFGYVGQPQLVDGRGTELVPNPTIGIGNDAQVVVNRWAGLLPILGPGLAEGREPGVIRTQPPCGAYRHGLAGGLSFVGEVPVPELRGAPAGVGVGVG